MDVKLDAETETLIKKELNTGRFSSASALVSTALRHYLIARGEGYTRDEMDQKIKRGISQLQEGKGIDGEEFFEGLRGRRP